MEKQLYVFKRELWVKDVKKKIKNGVFKNEMKWLYENSLKEENHWSKVCDGKLVEIEETGSGIVLGTKYLVLKDWCKKYKDVGEMVETFEVVIGNAEYFALNCEDDNLFDFYFNGKTYSVLFKDVEHLRKVMDSLFG